MFPPSGYVGMESAAFAGYNRLRHVMDYARRCCTGADGRVDGEKWLGFSFRCHDGDCRAVEVPEGAVWWGDRCWFDAEGTPLSPTGEGWHSRVARTIYAPAWPPWGLFGEDGEFLGWQRVAVTLRWLLSRHLALHLRAEGLALLTDFTALLEKAIVNGAEVSVP
jgi:hypothetical protein